jgi:hypothetical protein
MPERFLLDITRVELTDHRGQTRVVPFIDALGPPRGFANHPGKAAMWSLRKTILRRTWLAGLLLGGSVTLVVGFVLGSLLIIPTIQRSTSHFFVAVVLSMPVFILGYEWLVLPIFRRLYRPAFTDGALSAKLCPFCLYDLAHTFPEPDGCSRCPECAGAWRFHRESSERPSVLTP